MTAAANGTCPYCKVLYEVGAQSCPSCGKAFPWTPEIDELRAELKSREPNRVRATLTLVEELYQSARGGPSVSAAALKGFIASWLFPRAIMVVGSMVSVVALLVQTVILYKQTQFNAVQAEAAQTDQSERLRARVKRLSLQIDLLSGIRPMLLTSSMGLCEEAECRSAELGPVLKNYIRGQLAHNQNVHANVAVLLELRRKHAVTQRIGDHLTLTTGTTYLLGDVPRQTAQLVRESIDVCLIPELHLRNAPTDVQSMADDGASDAWHTYTLDSATKVPRPGEQKAIASPEIYIAQRFGELVSVGSFLDDGQQQRARVRAALAEIQSQCQAVLDRDLSRLRDIESNLGGAIKRAS